jgi:hypothetical protein
VKWYTSTHITARMAMVIVGMVLPDQNTLPVMNTEMVPRGLAHLRHEIVVEGMSHDVVALIYNNQCVYSHLPMHLLSQS